MKDKADKKTIDMLKEPPKTGAERQKAYRQRLKEQHSAVRLDLMLDSAVNSFSRSLTVQVIEKMNSVEQYQLKLADLVQRLSAKL